MNRNMFSNKLSQLILVAVVCAGMLLANAPAVQADGDVTIDIGSISGGGTGYTFAGGVVTITDAGSYTITGNSSNTLAVAGNIAGVVFLTLNGVQIDYYKISRTPLLIGANDAVIMTLSGSNTLSARQQYSSSLAGIAVPSNSYLTISGDGSSSLMAVGSGTGAGIGTTDLADGSGGRITIESGTVSATGGYNSGNSNSGINGVIVINGGSVTATGGQASGGGSGSGLGGNVTINGGTVVADGGQGNYGGAGIGGSAGQPGGTIMINGGNVTATGTPITEYSGAGIGGGYCGAGGNITINGGTVTAIAGSESAGIGGGKAGLGGHITITNQNGDTHVSATGSGGAGIGCGYYISSDNTTNITISGGTVIADGRSGQGSAGIGGSYFCGDDTNQIIRITGGDVTATGGLKSAGIGGAYNGGGGTILISDGQVTATGGDQGAGIGCGYNWQAATNGGTISISGGTVNATGGNYGAGIGGGFNAAGGAITIGGDMDSTSVTAVGGNGGAGIGGGVDQASSSINGSGGTIEIYGGTVTATGHGGGAGIGGGQNGNAGSIEINGGWVSATTDLADNAAGIGSGKGSTYMPMGANEVTINGGYVYAAGAYDIGGGSSYSSYATTNIFNAGSVNAASVLNAPTSGPESVYKTVVTVTNVINKALTNEEITYWVDGNPGGISSVTDDAGKLYLWLPKTPGGGVTTVKLSDGDNEYVASGKVTDDNASVMTAIEQTYEIAAISDQTFTGLTEGYEADSQETKTIQITNTGTGQLNNLQVSLGTGEDAYFDLTAPSVTTIAAGEHVDFTIKAKSGLVAGDYTAKVTIEADKISDMTFGVSQNVQPILVAFMNDGTLFASRNAHYNVSIGASNWPADPAKTGYTFDGWFTDAGDQVFSDTVITQDMTVTAKLTKADYSITYNLNGCTVDPGNPAGYNVDSGTFTLMNPVWAGYTFDGWSGTGIVGTSTNVTISTGSTGNRAYTANWTATAHYSISVAASSTSYGSVTGAGSYLVGTVVTVKATPKAVCRFVRWLEGSTTVSTSAQYTFTVSANRTLKAEFATIATPALTAAAAGYDSVKLTWGAVTGAAEYEVYRATSGSGKYSNIGTATGTNYSNTGLATGKTYYYKVQAKCVAGSIETYGGYSSAKSAKPTLATPTSFAAASASYNSVKLTWGAVAGETMYQVYRATSSRGTYTKLADVSSTAYTSTGLTCGKTYYYKVRAYRLVSGVKVYGSYCAVLSAKPVPAAPSNLQTLAMSETSVKLSWGAVEGVTKYEIDRSTTSATGVYTKLAETASVSFTDTGYTLGKTYYYKVRAYRMVGRTKVYGPFAAIQFVLF